MKDEAGIPTESMKKVGFPYKEHRPQFGWLAGWLAGGLAGWRVGWLAGGLAGWRVGWLIRLLVSTCEYSLGRKQRKIHLKEKQQNSMKKQQ